MDKKWIALIVCFGIIILILMILHPGKPPEQVLPQFRSNPLKLPNSTVNDEDPSLLQDHDGTIYIAWFSKRNSVDDIWITYSKDHSIWSDPRPIITAPTSDYYPTLIQSDDGIFHLSWFGVERYTGYAEIYYSNSRDTITWSDPLKIAPNPAIDWVPSIMQDQDGVLRITWTSNRSGNKEIYMVSSRDGGNTWTDPRQLTFSTIADDYPFLAQLENYTYILTWTRYTPQGESALSTNPTAEIVYSTSIDLLNWSDPVVISAPDPEQKVTDVYPIIFEHKNSVYISWTSNRAEFFGDIVARSLISDTIIPLITSDKADYTGRVVSLNDTTLAIVWVSNREGTNAIYYQEFYWE